MGQITFNQDTDEDFSQISIALSGFEPNGLYLLAIHDSGDTTDKCANVGSIFNPQKEIPPQGYFGSFNANDQGKISALINEFPLLLHDITEETVSQSILNRSCVIHKLINKKQVNSAQCEEFEVVKLDCAPLKEIEEPAEQEEGEGETQIDS